MGRYIEKTRARVIINRIDKPRREEHDKFVRELCEMQERKKNYFVCEQKDKGATNTR